MKHEPAYWKVLNEDDWNFKGLSDAKLIQCFHHEIIREKAIRGLPLYYKLTTEEFWRDRMANEVKRKLVTDERLAELKKPFPRKSALDSPEKPLVPHWIDWVRPIGELQDSVELSCDTIERDKSTIVAFEIDWRRSNTYWKDVFLTWLKDKRPKAYDLCLKSVNDVSDIPDEGERLVIVARHGAENKLHFRVFNTREQKFVDKSESEFPNKSAEIAELKAELVDLWDQEPSRNEKKRIIDRVSSVTSYTLHDEIKIESDHHKKAGAGAEIRQAETDLKTLGAVRLLDRYKNNKDMPSKTDEVLGLNAQNASFWSKAKKKFRELLQTDTPIMR